MDSDIVLFWFVVVVGLSGAIGVARRARSVGAGWIIVFVAVLAVDMAGWAWNHGLIYAAFAMWILFVMIPGLLSRVYYQRLLQQRYSDALRWARWVSWLHPADGWREQIDIIRALEQAQRGEVTQAMAALERFQKIKSLVGLVAVANLYRITNRWEEFRDWAAHNERELGRHPQLLPTLLRARGETGDLQGLSDLYARHQKQIGKMVPMASRDLCRLLLFAFGGSRPLVERLLAGSLAMLPEPTRQFWLATADLASGNVESARTQLERLLPAADPPMRLAIERRLSRMSMPPPGSDPNLEYLVSTVGFEHRHDELFGAQPSLFSRHGRLTRSLIALNILVFCAEIYYGGSTNLETLHQLGGLFPPAVRAGQWWRLVASLFLHYGPAHLAMNMFGLWVLGPFVEFALGAWRFLLVYLVAGIGSMALVMALASGPAGEQLTVGASGCIMGLVGATGAVMLRGWLREKALSARRRLLLVAIILLMQSLFDLIVPHVSMAAHLSGTLLGFLTTLVLADRLKVVGSKR